MTPRQNEYDPLEPTNDPRWLETRDRQGRLLEFKPLPPGSDLHRVFVASILEHIDAGWKLREFGSRLGTFLCDRGNDGHQVVALEPGTRPPSSGRIRRGVPGVISSSYRNTV